MFGTGWTSSSRTPTTGQSCRLIISWDSHPSPPLLSKPIKVNVHQKIHNHNYSNHNIRYKTYNFRRCPRKLRDIATQYVKLCPPTSLHFGPALVNNCSTLFWSVNININTTKCSLQHFVHKNGTFVVETFTFTDLDKLLL